MPAVKPKKALGQHFLHDRPTAQRIVDSLQATDAENVLEIGPGMGVLTSGLLERYAGRFWAVEIDRESVDYLREALPALGGNMLPEDFLKIDLPGRFAGKLAIVGNLPYNISSQIFFSIIQNRQQVTEAVVMVQREVALRIVEKPGSRTYGILSVLLQAYYDVGYLFTVNEGAFTPPPKVKSAVIRLTRNGTLRLGCNEELFIRVVKASFSQRRKTLRNAIRSGFASVEISGRFAPQRAEQLSVSDFVELTNEVERAMGNARPTP